MVGSVQFSFTKQSNAGVLCWEFVEMFRFGFVVDFPTASQQKKFEVKRVTGRKKKTSNIHKSKLGYLQFSSIFTLKQNIRRTKKWRTSSNLSVVQYSLIDPSSFAFLQI